MRLSEEERRALEVTECAQHAVMDAAQLCSRAGMGSQVMQPLDQALKALQYAIDTMRGAN